ncbi:MAG: entericidin A/B family lipoprotein [Aquabacterium sp.]|jgi:predicted small secreted protein|nr:MAG: entericidin A/B family lipoprotein [Aquabacterium sp.]TAL20918.1 MAG: entericidin A/B family lipoprotein [Aquabacterium sp.]
MRKTYWIAIAALVCGCFAGCNTVDGLGKDIEKAGGAISNSAKH